MRPVRELAETSADSVDQASKSAETFHKFDGIDARTRTCLPASPKPHRQTTNVSQAGPESAPLARVSSQKLFSRAGLSQAGAQFAETFADFVAQVGKSPETFLKSDDTEAGPRTYLPGLPKSPRQASQIGGGSAKSGP